jgi:hypothetical protein
MCAFFTCVCAFASAKHNNKKHFTRRERVASVKPLTRRAGGHKFLAPLFQRKGILFFHLIAKWRARVAPPPTDKLFAGASGKKGICDNDDHSNSLACTKVREGWVCSGKLALGVQNLLFSTFTFYVHR